MSDVRPIDPVTITLIDGQARKCLLSFGGIRRLKERFEVKTIQELLNRDVEEVGVPILYESMLDRNGMTEEQLANNLASNIVDVTRAILSLLGVSFPESKDRPPIPTPDTTIQ